MLVRAGCIALFSLLLPVHFTFSRILPPHIDAIVIDDTRRRQRARPPGRGREQERGPPNKLLF